MKIQLISHACIIIETSDCKILCDPWLKGRAFNKSWELLPKPLINDDFFEKIDFLWISHEHPDHFDVLTLRSLPEFFKSNVTVLYQHMIDEKIPQALEYFGFKKIVILNHKRFKSLTKNTEVFLYQVGQMDSCLAVLNDDEVILNLNDCEASDHDCKYLFKILPKVDVLLSQFSIAGFDGNINTIREKAKNKLKTLAKFSSILRSNTTIPFASFVYFCCKDNKILNKYTNTVGDVSAFYKKTNLDLTVLYPGEELIIRKRHDSNASLKKFLDLTPDMKSLNYSVGEIVELDKIITTIENRIVELKERHSALIINLITKLHIRIPDLNQNITIDFKRNSIRVKNLLECDLEINSQPLYASFAFPYGIQTLGVSGRLKIINYKLTWKLLRIITSLDNNGIYLRPKYLFTKNTIKYLKYRFRGGIGQIYHRVKIRYL